MSDGRGRSLKDDGQSALFELAMGELPLLIIPVLLVLVLILMAAALISRIHGDAALITLDLNKRGSAEHKFEAKPRTRRLVQQAGS